MRAVFALLLVLLLPSCSAEKFLNAWVPDTGYRLVQGVAYGSDARQKLDIYIPDTQATPSCVILFYYGGAWDSGDRAMYKFAGQAFASEGCVAVVADYRLYPRIKYPAFVEDAAAALVWVHGNIAQYGGDANRIFLAGHSAGAYNAAMVAAHPQYLKNAGGKREWIRGVIGVAGPYDFKPSEEEPGVKDAFSTVADAASMPVAYIGKGLPPMLLAHGRNDRRVKLRNTESLANKLREQGNEVEEIIYPSASHTAIIVSLMVNNRYKIPLLRDIMSFVRNH